MFIIAIVIKKLVCREDSFFKISLDNANIEIISTFYNFFSFIACKSE